MFNNLTHIISTFFRSERQRQEDQSMLDGLLSEDKMDEATAYALLLTDLARSDGNFDKNEKTVIEKTLLELFPGRSEDAEILIRTANNVLDTFRESSSFITRIKEEYSQEERDKLYNLIDKVIASDNFEDPVETYLRQKFKTALA